MTILGVGDNMNNTITETAINLLKLTLSKEIPPSVADKIVEQVIELLGCIE